MEMEKSKDKNLELTAEAWADQLGRVAKIQFMKYAKGERTLEEVEAEVRGDLDKMIAQFREMKGER